MRREPPARDVPGVPGDVDCVIADALVEPGHEAQLDADLHRQFIQTIFESHSNSRIDLQVGVQLGLVARFYERIGDHAVNVAGHTRYIASGWLPTHPYAESGNEISPGAAARSEESG